VKPHNQGLWYLLQSKRLLKKPSFVVLLALLPLLVWGLGLAETEESGMLRIALYAENPQDELVSHIVDDLMTRQSVLSFSVARDIEEAYYLVQTNQADAAWVFPDGLQRRMNDFTAYRSSRDPLVQIIEREDNVALQLAREVLFGALARSNAYAIYRGFIIENVAGGEVSEAELEQVFAETTLNSNWLRRTYLDYGLEGLAPGYLTAPLRGLLSLFVVLCGLASALYYKQDKESGLYVPFSPCYHGPAVVMGGLCALAALALTGYFTLWYREIFLMALLILAVIAFADVLRILLPRPEHLAAAIPIVVLLMLVLCPVFFTIRTAGFFPWLMPPFYYLNALHNQAFAYYLCLYIIVLFGLRLTLSVNKKMVAAAIGAAAAIALVWTGGSMREVRATPAEQLSALTEAESGTKLPFLAVTLTPEEELLAAEEEPEPPRYLVAIDPGHQAQGNNDREPLGPGSKEEKRKVAVGTIGTVTRVMEHELNLAVALKLRDELIARGFDVYMTRETAEVDISNVERAVATNEAGADITVRIHANGLKNREVSGIMVLCTTSKNRFVPHLYDESRALSEAVMAAMIEATGARDRGIWEVDDLSGLNWSTMPNTLVEMGFMTNPAEDRLMQTEEYQLKLAQGIADGIEVYFNEQQEHVTGY
jgi:N-acetylmuramoyl-L-alanine amidase